MILFDRDHWQEILEALAKNKLRTLLTAFGVFWGIFLLVVLLGAGNGIQNGVLRQFGGVATNSFFVWGGSTSRPWAGLKAGRWVMFDNDDTAAIRREVPEVGILAPRASRGMPNVVRGTKLNTFRVLGDEPAIFGIESLRIVRGRFLNELDLAEARKVAVIGSRPREVLFEPGEDPLGEAIEIGGVSFKVIGVFESRQLGGSAEWQQQTIYVPSTYQQAFNYRDRVGYYAATAAPGVPAPRRRRSCRGAPAQGHRSRPTTAGRSAATTSRRSSGRSRAFFTGIHALMWLVGLGTAAGAIGVSNIMLIVARADAGDRDPPRGGRRPRLGDGADRRRGGDLTAPRRPARARHRHRRGRAGRRAAARRGHQRRPADVPEPRSSRAMPWCALTVLVAAGALAGVAPAQRAIAVPPSSPCARSDHEEALRHPVRPRLPRRPRGSGTSSTAGPHKPPVVYRVETPVRTTILEEGGRHRRRRPRQEVAIAAGLRHP